LKPVLTAAPGFRHQSSKLECDELLPMFALQLAAVHRGQVEALGATDEEMAEARQQLAAVEAMATQRTAAASARQVDAKRRALVAFRVKLSRDTGTNLMSRVCEAEAYTRPLFGSM